MKKYIHAALVRLAGLAKPTSYNINGFKVREPIRAAPEVGARYWIADPTLDNFAMASVWSNDSADRRWLALGLCHLKFLDAEAHAKALLSFSRVAA